MPCEGVLFVALCAKKPEHLQRRFGEETRSFGAKPK